MSDAIVVSVGRFDERRRRIPVQRRMLDEDEFPSPNGVLMG